jgi:amino-acid N-acetyltransferase
MGKIDIRPDPGQLPETEVLKIDKMLLDIIGDSDYPIRKARVTDVKGILTLINSFAASNLMLARGPQYIYENIRDFLVAVDDQHQEPEYPPEQSSHLIIACASLHVLWENVAEIRSTAIHPDYQHKGLGRKLIDQLKIEAKGIGINMLFTWTLAEDFFSQIGFKRKGKEELPPKVWGECSRCPKYFKCNEVGMVLEI